MTLKNLATKPRSGQKAKKHERLSKKRERKVRVDPSKNSTYVINLLLDKGDLEAARWALRHFSRELIAETLRTKWDFELWTALFWRRYIGIPRE